jgi:hypothetical protein
MTAQNMVKDFSIPRNKLLRRVLQDVISSSPLQRSSTHASYYFLMTPFHSQHLLPITTLEYTHYLTDVSKKNIMLEK